MPHDAESLHSLPEYIRALARLGQKTAILEHGLYRSRRYSYGEIIGRAFGFEAELRRRGVKPGDRVMVWGANGAAWAVALYGCVLAGAAVVPLDAAYSPELARRVREQTEAVLLCTDHDEDLGTTRLDFGAVLGVAPVAVPDAVPAAPGGALLEIVYTSGATADPKGVMITHGNVLANLRPIAGEVAKYRRKMSVVLPIGFVHLIPLSHLFGQIMGLFIPPLVDSYVIYPESRAPAQWAAVIRQHRASALVAVPQQLQMFSQWTSAELGVTHAEAAEISRGHKALWRMWRWRKWHRRLGWKMWAFIVGGAALPAEIESFWHALGYAVVQGYGLTETAPAIAVTHPFKIKRGAVGQTLADVEVKIAPDGEILVRGGNVSPGYYRNPEATAQTFADGWLHTGDLGSIDGDKNLTFLGRKKEVIVTANGLNVYPEDVEQALNRQPEVAESAAVEDRRGGGGQVHVVAVLEPGGDQAALDRAVAAANARLEPHQRIRAASIWPRPQLPRTTSTHKLQRTAIARWVNQDTAAAPEVPGDGRAADWKQFVQQHWGVAAGRLSPEARLDTDLGLSSLDRVELWSWIEGHAPGTADEAALAMAQTVSEVDALLAPAAAGMPDTGAAPAAAAPSPLILPSQEKTWPLRPAVRGFRAAMHDLLVFPFLRTAVSRIAVSGAETLEHLRRPVLFVPNHQSLLDVPLILRALPREWRRWVAPAMGIDPYVGAFDPRAGGWRRFRDRWRLRLSRLFFNGYLLTPQGAVAESLRHTGRLADAGYCPLIFPEGRRTPDGRIHPFRPGIGLFVANLGLPVVPVRIQGLYEILPDKARRARRGPAAVHFGPVMRFDQRAPEEIRVELENWFRMAQ